MNRFTGPLKRRARRADRTSVARLPVLSTSLLLGLLAAGASGAGEVYRWTGADGTVHYTSDLERVPAEQREAAKASVGRYTGGAVMRIESRPPAARAPAAEPMPAEAASAPPAQGPSYGGLDEATWRAEGRKLRDAVAALEAEAEACRAEDFRRSAGAGGRAEELASADACGRMRSELQTNRRWLEAFEDDAHRAGVPPGWLRD
jgi:hypothetical protein